MKEELFNKLYEETFDEITKYVICNCSNINDINDIIQTIYLDIFKIINKDNYDLLNKSYIKAIAKNKINDYYRHDYKEKIISLFSKEIVEEYEDEKINIEKEILTKYDVNKVWNYLKNKPKLAKIFYLYFTYGLTIPEISKELKMNQSTIKNYIYRTLKKLKKYMKEDEIKWI